MLVIGDSLADGFGQLLVQQAQARGLPIDVVNRGTSSTGLSRADYYDWPENFARQAAGLQPDIVVAHFGANDMQTVLAPEGRTGYGTRGMGGGLPRPDPQDPRGRGAAPARCWSGSGPARTATPTSTAPRHGEPALRGRGRGGGRHLLSLRPSPPPNGVFERNVTIDGSTVAMRTGDGSHFTGRGYRLVADRLLDHADSPLPRTRPGGRLAAAGQRPARPRLAVGHRRVGLPDASVRPVLRRRPCRQRLAALARTGAARKAFLIAASYVFYAAWDWRFCFLMAGVSLVAWAGGLRARHSPAARSPRSRC